MLAVAHAASLLGIDAHPVRVEVQLGRGLPGPFDVVGLPERAVRESRVRVRAALDAAGFEPPGQHLVVNLAPGDVRKHGAGFDLAIAVAILAACDHLFPRSRLRGALLLGELSLGGGVRPIRGVLPLLSCARDQGLERAIVPTANAAEAALVHGVDVRCAGHLLEVVAWLKGEAELPRASECCPETFASGPPPEDLADVRGQAGAKRALEIAAAGNHHVLFVGPPGAGKTMLARRLAGLLPPPDEKEALSIATVASAAGLRPPSRIEAIRRPFRAPHHSASSAALVGGGEPVRPGEVTLADGGVLFLDELPEFRRDVIESLRCTMESGRAVIARARYRVDMPASPLVVAAMNPCPCGHAGDPGRVCTCPADRAERYRARVSGPLLDRFDMHVSVPRVAARSLRRLAPGESSAAIRERVMAARARRSTPSGPGSLDPLAAATDAAGLRLLERAVERLGLSVRAYVKVLRLARTIADLAASDRATAEHVAEAIQYRLLDRSTPQRDELRAGA